MIKQLPYRANFEPEYEQLNLRQMRIPIEAIPYDRDIVRSKTEQVTQKMQENQQRINEEDLEFNPENIYTQYASEADLRRGRANKNKEGMCPGCGDIIKKEKYEKQCNFCGIVYCEKCCSRSRVLPNLSEPKDSRLQCDECHGKFVKLIANQQFYKEAAILQKIVSIAGKRLKKTEQDLKVKGQKVEEIDRKKKQYKIRSNVLNKQLKDEQKKVEELQAKLQETVRLKYQQMKKEQERIESEKKIRDEEQELQREQKRKEEEEKLIQEQAKLNQQRQKESEAQRLLQLQASAEKYRRQQLEAAQQKQRIQQQVQQRQRQLKLQQQLRQSDPAPTQQLDSQQQYNGEAEQITGRPTPQQDQNKANPAPIIDAGYRVEGQPDASPTKFSDPDNDLVVNNSAQKQQQASNPPLLAGLLGAYLKQDKTSSSSMYETKQSAGRYATPQQFTTELDPISIIAEADLKAAEPQKEERVETIPEIAIKVSEMTVKELLGIHINPNDLMQGRRKSAMPSRDSYTEEKKIDYRASTEYREKININEEKKMTEEEKQSILRSSKSNSLLQSTPEEEETYENPDPMGTKCNCSIM